VSSIKPDGSGGEVDGGEEISGGLVVARGDGSELLELAEEVLNQVTLFVELSVEFARRQAIGSTRDYGRFPSRRQRFEHPAISVIGAVGDQQFGLHVRQQRISAGQVVGLPGGQQEAQRIAEGVDQCVDLRAQATSAAAEGLVLNFF
jgi:hypothetical protein